MTLHPILLRRNSEGSDVYVYEGEDEQNRPVLRCCDCLLCPELPDEGWRASRDEQTGSGMAAHLRAHQQAGHCVPEVVFRRIQKRVDDGEIAP